MGNIGNIIKERRKELKLSLKDIANKLNVSESLISRYESGEIKNMGIDKIIPLSEILKIETSELLENINFSTRKKKITSKEIEIANRLKELRNKNHLTLQEVADIMKVVGKVTIQRYENGDITNIPVDNIESLAKIYNVTPAYIMGWETERKEKLGDNINNKRKLYSDEDNYREIIKKLNNFSNDELSKIRRIIEVIFEEDK